MSSRVVGVTLAIALAFEVWLLVEMRNLYPTMALGESLLSATIINLLMAFGIMYATLVADEMVAVGANRLRAYAFAVALGSAAGAVAQWQVHQWLHVVPVNIDTPTPNPVYDVSRDLYQPAVAVTQPAVMFFEFLIWGSIIVFIYVNRRTTLLATARMNAAQVERAHAQRRTLESRLQALQARVEPQFLFSTLAQVRDLYDSDPVKGARVLDDLIAYLRAALPHLRESTSTLRQELELLGAYLRIMRVRLGRRLALDVDAPQTVLDGRVPSMMLLPLVNHVLAEVASSPAAGAIRVVARPVDVGLRLEVSGEGVVVADGSAILRDIRDRLQGLYGNRGTLARETSPPGWVRIVMEIPHESPDSGHR